MPTTRPVRLATAAALTAVLVLMVVFLVARRTSEIGGTAQPGGSATATTSMTMTTTTMSTASVSTTNPPTSRSSITTPSTTAAPLLPESLRGKDITLIPTSSTVVALTFDAGANSAGLNKILATLAEQRVPATFFLTGNWAAANPAGVSAIRAAGHRIGNHSVSHPSFPGLTDAQLVEQVRGAERAIRAAGADPRPLFRFPYGDRNARTIDAVNALGYLCVRWTVDTLGWKGTSGGMSATRVTDRAVGLLQPGEIVLMHIGSNPDDGSTLDADALPTVIARTRASGYGFVTLDLLLGR